MTDWKPVNPCTADCISRDSYCPPRNRFGCAAYEIYQGKIDTARQLLEYLIETASGGHLQGEMDGFDRDAIGLPELESILKTLEASQ